MPFNRIFITRLVLVFFGISFLNHLTAQPFISQKDIFVSGTDSYHTFRIPSIIVAPKGTILAFCEGRKNRRADTGDIDLVLKRSFDGGKIWQSLQIVWDEGLNVCGNPCPVVDRETGTIWLLMTHNLAIDHEREIWEQSGEGTRTVWITSSIDDGATWSPPKDITASTKASDWTWYATGPGVGIQLSSGRLVIPCDHGEAQTNKYFSHIIFSDDHGQTWQIGGTAGDKTNECQVVERVDGSLLLNMRNYSNHRLRALATSADAGLNWSAVTYDFMLPEPICQASLLRFTDEECGDRNRILFSNPASNTSRILMTVRLSYDEAKTWPVAKILHPGPAAYSCLTILPDQTIACLYERGEESPYEKITFAHFNLEWLTEGEERIGK